ncbi:C-type lectin domain family 10 member A-like [Acanthopagrus latus]|uniref:C-type lectin domain family 10 member A-like n=1 Tax=Acanthopagrus latus TaxID=8177 RepID=UPI00187BD8A5|nr:C-type lectin domain family 10 member A-like [Acanthopagrus latus]
MDVVLLLLMAASGLSAVSAEFLRRLYFVSTQRNMTEAQRYCREKYIDLATIKSTQSVSFLNSTAANFYWIGLYDDVNSWRWSLSDTRFYRNGETEFRQWGTQQPDNLNSTDSL